MNAIIDYRAGNLTSVKLAFETLDAPAVITHSPSEILEAERVVFPGVGAAGAAMAHLTELGLADTIRQVVARGTPFLGICLGTQIVFESLEEDGGVAGLGLIPGDVKRFAPSNPLDKVPQMGWNQVHCCQPHAIFEGLEDNSEFYFVHSYYPAPRCTDDVYGTTDYADVTFCSAVGRGNLFATQFHPEKSGRIGLRLLSNFINWTPTA